MTEPTTHHATSQPTPPPPSSPAGPERRLTRSEDDRMVAGVCGGLGRHLDIDPVWVRIGFVLLAAGTGTALVAYLALWILVPSDGDVSREEHRRPVDPGPTPGPGRRAPASLVVGLVFIAIGGLIFINTVLPSIGRFFWPAALVGIGLALLVSGRTDGGAR